VLKGDIDQFLKPMPLTKINFIYNWRMHSCQLYASHEKITRQLEVHANLTTSHVNLIIDEPHGSQKS